MRVRVKHLETEIEVCDSPGYRTAYALVHYNQDYVLQLITKMTEEIKSLNTK